MTMMNKVFLLVCAVLLLALPVKAQRRVVDATDKLPVSTASIFDATGNVVGLTWDDGDFSKIPDAAYPLTIRCMGYEPLVIERPEDKSWEMMPVYQDMGEVVVIPVRRNILKQKFYVRQYFSMSNPSDTVTFFIEYMANRLVRSSREDKFGGNSSLRIRATRCYGRYNVDDRDSCVVNPETPFPSFLNLLHLEDEQITLPESFTQAGDKPKIYEEPGKSGMKLVLKQNAQSFVAIMDMLAEEKDHTYSPWALKALGCTMDFNQLYKTEVYRANDTGVYLPKDLTQASFVMEAEGRGKFIRMALNSDKPVDVFMMIEIYLVENDFLSKEEAKAEYKDKSTDAKFEIPAFVPSLDAATLQLVERAKAEAAKRKSEPTGK